jgi:hypothetical protein
MIKIRHADNKSNITTFNLYDNCEKLENYGEDEYFMGG